MQPTRCAAGHAARRRAPANGSTVSGPVTFPWNGVAGAIDYKLFAGVGSATPAEVGTTTATTLTATIEARDQYREDHQRRVAADAVALELARGEFHAVIGPNGAGKTTLIGLLAGEIPPHAGSIRFDGSDITRLRVDRRSRLGIARSFQITSLFSDFSALDNVALAVQAHCGHSFRFWKDARRGAEWFRDMEFAVRLVKARQVIVDGRR